MLTFSVSAILGKPQGALQRFDFNEAVAWSGADNPVLAENVVGSVQFLKLPHEINVQVSNLHTAVRDICSRCLKPIACPIHVDFAEREFIIDLPERDLEAGEEVKRVDLSANKIDLNDMIREEIFLHYPFIPVCSQSCKGLCGKCGIDLNEKTCNCVHDDTPRISPFKLPKA